MSLWSSIQSFSIDLFRHFTKGAKIDAALVFNGRMRLRAGDVGVKPGTKPIEYEPGKFAYDAEDVLRRWEIISKYRLKLKNNSSQPAYNIELVNAKEIFDKIETIPALLSLQPNESIEFEVEFHQVHIAHSGVEADKLPGVPASKEQKILEITYQNEARTKMKTNFYVSVTEPRNEYVW